MKVDDINSAQAIIKCLRRLSKFDPENKDDVLHLTLHKYSGEDNCNEEYSLGGHYLIPQIIEEQRKKLYESALSVGLVFSIHEIKEMKLEPYVNKTEEPGDG